MFGTFLKSALTVAATGAAALTGVALASDAYVYTRRKLVGSSSSSTSTKKKSKKSKAKKAVKAVKAKARRRSPAAKLSKNRKAA